MTIYRVPHRVSGLLVGLLGAGWDHLAGTHKGLMARDWHATGTHKEDR
jgi:hypothetical protein